jgi:hypothetical protein
MSARNSMVGPPIAIVDQVNPASYGSSNIGGSSTKSRSSSVTLDRNHVTENEDRYDVDDAREPTSEKSAPSRDSKDHNLVA